MASSTEQGLISAFDQIYGLLIEEDPSYSQTQFVEEVMQLIVSKEDFFHSLEIDYLEKKQELLKMNSFHHELKNKTLFDLLMESNYSNIGDISRQMEQLGFPLSIKE